MGSLAHRTLLNFVESEEIVEFRSFLGSHQAQIDDRDENGTTCLMVCRFSHEQSFDDVSKIDLYPIDLCFKGLNTICP